MQDATATLADWDAYWMSRALAEARLGLGRVEPNPMVGAAVVRDGELIAVGYHEAYGGPHAEVHALRRAGDAARGATLYVTLEPCCHYGKTPPCTEAILAAGVTRVVAAVRDPFPKVAGGGFQRLVQAGVIVDVGCGEAEAKLDNAPYWMRLTHGRPFVTAKWAMTADGKTASASGDSRWISSAASRALVHENRGRADAIAVGIGTVLADDPLLSARPAGVRTPTRVVLDSLARTPIESRLVSTAREIPVLIAVTQAAPVERVRKLEALGCEVWVQPGHHGRIAIAELLQDMGKRQWTNLIVEGGGHTLGGFFDADLVDAVDIYLAPTLIGGAATHNPIFGAGCATIAQGRRLENLRVSVIGGDVRIQATVG